MPDCPQPSMKYPPEARRQGLEGVVRLRLMIDESGKVTKIKLVKKAHPLLDKAAKDLVRAMRCKPGRAGKQKVAVPIPYDVTFLLDDW